MENILLLTHLKQVYKSLQGLPVVFQAALQHVSPSPWLNQKQDVQKLDAFFFQISFFYTLK